MATEIININTKPNSSEKCVHAVHVVVGAGGVQKKLSFHHEKYSALVSTPSCFPLILTLPPVFEKKHPFNPLRHDD